jgi:hypothetical protein
MIDRPVKRFRRAGVWDSLVLPYLEQATMPRRGGTIHGKGSSMSDISYKGYTIKLRSRPLP